MSAEVWIVDDDAGVRWVMRESLEAAGFSVRAFERGRAALDALAGARPAVMVTDVRLPDLSGTELLGACSERDPPVPVVVVTAYADLDNAVAAYQGGAFEYLPKPFDLEALAGVVRRAAGDEAAAAGPDAGAGLLVGRAPAMQAVFRAVGRLAATRLPVLITGESGTGKERVARALHAHGPRRGAPFVAVNVAAIPAELMESELFGHERGAFTGAHARRAGCFEQAAGGTLFLDEIGDMPLGLQTRLLRVLAEGEYHRVGGSAALRADVRVVAATHHDLAAQVRAGDFREDLYHRLAVVPIAVPPLRDRCEDIPRLADYLLGRAGEELGVARKRFSEAALDRLVAWRWPGNVRELDNLCRRLTALAPGAVIEATDLPREWGGNEPQPDWAVAAGDWAARELARGGDGLWERAGRELERRLLRAALAASGGNRQEAARRLGIGRNTLSRKLARLRREE